MLPHLTCRQFAECLNQNFKIQADATTFSALQLVETETLSTHSAPENGRQAFSLIFSGPLPILPQGTYVMEHETLGAFPLFMVPIASGQNEVQYQAIFN